MSSKGKKKKKNPPETEPSYAAERFTVRTNSTSQNASLLLLVRIVDSHMKVGNLEAFCSLKQFISYSIVFVPKYNILLDYIAAFPLQLSGGRARSF